MAAMGAPRHATGGIHGTQAASPHWLVFSLRLTIVALAGAIVGILAAQWLLVRLLAALLSALGHSA